jgi:hypothetical protein
VALLILSVMLAMAAIGFTYAWLTTETRRQRDHMGAVSATASPQVVRIAPAKLASLGYLPAGTDAMAGIHVAELMAERSMEPVMQLLRSHRAELGISRFEHLTGLRLEELDHIVLGLRSQEDIIPHLFLIVRTRRPYDAQAVRAKLNVKRPIELPGKTVHRFALEQTQLIGSVWFADERTLVFGWQPNDLIELPTSPIARVERFPDQIAKYLLEPAMGPGTEIWAVSASRQWEKYLVFLHLLGLDEADQRVFSRVRALCSRLHCDERVIGQFECKCIDAAGAESFENYLDKKGLGSRNLLSIAAREPRAAGLVREIAESLVRKRNGENVHVQFSMSIPTICEALSHVASPDRAVE